MTGGGLKSLNSKKSTLAKVDPDLSALVVKKVRLNGKFLFKENY